MSRSRGIARVVDFVKLETYRQVLEHVKHRKLAPAIETAFEVPAP